MSTALFDIGATKTRVAVVQRGNMGIRRPIIFATNQNYAIGVRELVNAIRTAADGWKISRVIGGVPGRLDRLHSKLVAAPNLGEWEGHPLRRDLHHLFQVPIEIENDATLGGLGEATHGAGRGKAIVAYLTISTGVGGTRIINGRVDAAASNFEPGHQVLVTSPRNHLVTLEDLVSGRGIRRRFHRDPASIRSRQTWERLAGELGLGVANVVRLWSPDVVVLGGGVMSSLKKYLPIVRASVTEALRGAPVPPIIPAKLGDSAALYGGLALLKRR